MLKPTIKTREFLLFEWLFRTLIVALIIIVAPACTTQQVQNPENFDLYNYLVEAEGVSSRPAEAFSFLKQEAEKGSYQAQTKLGTYYYIGRGTTQNFKKSFEWYKKAAEQADDSDMRPEFVIGVLYAKGQGTKQNLREAVTWFKIASSIKDQEGELARQFLQWIKQHPEQK
jgi:TPR repeat protein